jgi:NAD(P)-dependent dehydrogenase (short-subunit alcohol dehydrogenase family)
VNRLRVSNPAGPFDGQWALVTGGGGGIGAALGEALAEGGARVGLVGRRHAPLARVARRIGPERSAVVVVDLTDERALAAALRAFLRRTGRLDLLVCSSGIHRAAPLERARSADFDRMYKTNVRGPFLVAQRLAPALRASAGQIVFINSSVGLNTRAGVGQYAATQHALRALADTFRAELNEAGVRVLSVYPGRTATPMQKRIYVAEGRPYTPERLLQPTDIARTVVAALALPRTAEVTDVSIGSLSKP